MKFVRLPFIITIPKYYMCARPHRGTTRHPARARDSIANITLHENDVRWGEGERENPPSKKNRLSVFDKTDYTRFVCLGRCCAITHAGKINQGAPHHQYRYLYIYIYYTRAATIIPYNTRYRIALYTTISARLYNTTTRACGRVGRWFSFHGFKKMISRVRRPPRGLGWDASRAMKTHTYITRSYTYVCVCVCVLYKLAYVGGGGGDGKV